MELKRFIYLLIIYHGRRSLKFSAFSFIQYFCWITASLRTKIKFDITRILLYLLEKRLEPIIKSNYCFSRITFRESGNIWRFRFVTKTVSWHQTAVTSRTDATRLDHRASLFWHPLVLIRIKSAHWLSHYICVLVTLLEEAQWLFDHCCVPRSRTLYDFFSNYIKRN